MWRRLNDVLPLSILVGTVLFITRYIWGNNAWIETHDGIFHMIRVSEYAAMLKAGGFPPRWAGNLDHGFGLPLFSFVYPLPYLLGSPLVLLGLSAKWVVKLLFLGFYLLGTLGVYACLAKGSRRIAVLSALLFATTPYLLVNIFVRGALGEFMAICLVPLVYLAWDDLSRRSFAWYHPLPFALLFLSHNFLSFLFLPLYLLLLTTRRESLFRALKSLSLSLCLSVFFVVPMFFERSFLYSVSTYDFTYNFRDHFVYLSQLLRSPWGHGYSVAGTADGLSFALPLGTLFILLASLLYERALLIVLLAVIMMLLPISQPLWELIPALQIIQFPWRLLALTTIILPYLFFRIIQRMPRNLQFLGVILVIFNLVKAIGYSRPPYLMNNAQVANELYIHSDQTTTSSRLELLPASAPLIERWRGDEQLRLIGEGEVVSLGRVTPLSLIAAVTSSSPATRLLIRRNFYPTWQAHDERGHKLTLSVSAEGEILMTPLVGTHTYTVTQASTVIEVIANLTSFITLLALLLLGIYSWSKNYLATRYDGYDLSIALRYLPIVRNLRARLKRGDTIIELGSEITGITPYLRAKVTGLDQGFDYKRRNRWLTPVEGSVLAIPFKDASFDYAISVDMLEHIKAPLRAKAVREMLRVTRRRVYLSFPVGHSSETVDRELDDYFYRRRKVHYNYLTEHVAYGLPSEDFIKKVLAKQPDWRLAREVPNTSLWLWRMMLKLALSNTPWKTSLYHRLLLLSPLLSRVNWGTCYRKLYIIEHI